MWWLIKFASLALLVFATCPVQGRTQCHRTIILKPPSNWTNFRNWPEISMHNPPHTECWYTVEAPRGYVINYACEISQTSKESPPNSLETANRTSRYSCDDNDELAIWPSGRQDREDSEIHCGLGSIRQTSTGHKLLMQMRFAKANRKLHCLVSLNEPSPCRCRGKNSNMARIVNGKEAGEHEFPMLAALLAIIKYPDTLGRPFCGATIISETFALTAAHSVIVKGQSRQLNWAKMVVGGWTDDLSLSPYAEIHGIRSITHPDYIAKNNYYDIALLKTDSRIKFNEAVGPVCLPWKFREKSFSGESIEVTGWGTTSFKGNASDVLLKVTLDVIENDVCARSFRYREILSEEMCTYTPDKDACQGDSGGPLFYTEPESGRLYLVGVVSNGIGCATTSPGINTRVTAYIDWINEVTHALAQDTAFCRI